MTHAELLRKHATDATNEGGMWFSGEYLSRIAETAESLEDENAKLRELVLIAIKYCDSCACDGCPIQGEDESCQYSDMARELGVEVDG